MRPTLRFTMASILVVGALVVVAACGPADDDTGEHDVPVDDSVATVSLDIEGMT